MNWELSNRDWGFKEQQLGKKLGAHTLFVTAPRKFGI
jgi:hypothetical protein